MAIPRRGGGGGGELPTGLRQRVRVSAIAHRLAAMPSGHGVAGVVQPPRAADRKGDTFGGAPF